MTDFLVGILEAGALGLVTALICGLDSWYAQGAGQRWIADRIAGKR